MDTIHFKLNREHFNYAQLHSILECKLNSNGSFIHPRESQKKSVYAKFNNWRFTLTEYNLIGKGSITKLAYGNNIKNICFEDLKLALTQLEAILEVDLKKANITRIDIGFNLVMNQPVFRYLPLVICPKSSKDFSVVNETRELRGKYQNLIFYDKIKETKKFKTPKPYKNLSLLRYELKCDKKVVKEISHEDLKFGRLYDEDVYESFVHAWFDNFLKLSTITLSETPQIDYKSVSSWKNSLISLGISYLGGFDFIANLNYTNCKNAKVKYDLKKFVLKLDKTPQSTTNLVEELRHKITYEFCNQLPDRWEQLNFLD